MKYLRQLLFYLSLAIVPVSFALPVLAEAKIDIDSETVPFKKKKIRAGAIEVVVNYSPLMAFGEERSDNLSYKIFYNGKMQVKASAYTANFAGISLQDLDNDLQPEVIVRTFSGGAHCCTNHLIYSWRNSQFITQETGYLNSIGGEFVDLDGDRIFEFATDDNTFLYAFSSYAGSFPPSLIYQFDRGNLIDVTRSHPKLLRERAQKMYEAIMEIKKGGEGEINGVLAGYVAQQILLGEYRQAWQFMLDNYDYKSDVGLDIYDGTTKIGAYPNFPAALKAFLIKNGYLDEKGQPYPLEKAK